MAAHDRELRQQLVNNLTQAQAHLTFTDALKGLPAELRGKAPANMPYSIWQLVEHIRMAQADILDFSINPFYKEIEWPADYWPKEMAPANEKEWKQSLQQIEKDREAFIALLQDESYNLTTPFTWGTGQHLLREALILADHNSYHTGEIVALRRMLGAWKK